MCGYQIAQLLELLHVLRRNLVPGLNGLLTANGRLRTAHQLIQHRVLILECAGIYASGLHGRAGVIEAGLCPVPIALRHVVLPLANRVQIAVIALELLAKLFVQIADVAAE
ncbi:hypothetical protein D3C71_1830240 [compost metagenome]